VELVRRATSKVETIGSMSLIIFPIFLLVFVGAQYNALVNSGLMGSGWTGCPNTPGTITGPCSLAGGSSIFSFASPFTYLFTGNFLGFVEYFFPQFQQINYYAQPQYLLNNQTIVGTGALDAPFDKGTAFCVNFANHYQNNIANPPTTWVFNCEFFQGVLGTSSTAVGGIPNPWWYAGSPKPSYSAAGFFIVASQNPYGSIAGQTDATGATDGTWLKNDTTFFVGEPQGSLGYGTCFYSNTDKCYYIMGITPVHTEPFNATYTDEFQLYLNGQTNTGSSNALGILSFMGFVMGALIILVLSLGIGVQATFLVGSLALNPNPQGTRLAQIVGFALLIFNPLYETFGGWLSTLSFGGTLTFVMLLIFGIGIFWRSVSLD
jgi:hypothetical protein